MMKKRYEISILIGLTVACIFVIVCDLNNQWTPEQWKAEYDKALEECMEDAPEGSVCLVDVYAPPPIHALISGALIIVMWFFYFDTIKKKFVPNNRNDS